MLQPMRHALQNQLFPSLPDEAVAWEQPGAEVICLSMCTAALAGMLQHKLHALLGAVLAMAQAQAQAQAEAGYLPRGLLARSLM